MFTCWCRISETQEQKKDEPKNANGKATFGPVIERTLSIGQDDSKPFLRLESGQLIAKPTELNGMYDATALRWTDWMEQNDVEVGLVKIRGELQLLCSNLPVYPIEPEAADRYWDRMTADELVAISRHYGAAFVDFESRHFVSLSTEKTPITLYYPTCGLLQITEVKAGQSTTVKIRYKLVASKHMRHQAYRATKDGSASSKVYSSEINTSVYTPTI